MQAERRWLATGSQSHMRPPGLRLVERGQTQRLSSLRTWSWRAESLLLVFVEQHADIRLCKLKAVCGAKMPLYVIQP